MIQQTCDDPLHKPISFHICCISSFFRKSWHHAVLSSAPQRVAYGSARTSCRCSLTAIYETPCKVAMRDGWASSTFELNLTAEAQVSQNRLLSGTAAERSLYRSVPASNPSSLFLHSQLHWFVLYFLYFVLSFSLPPSAMLAGNETLSGWTASPQGRGTFDIVLTWIFTIILCCWTTVCPNVPALTDGRWAQFRDKFDLACIGLLGPEFLLGISLGQRSSASLSVKVHWQSSQILSCLNVNDWWL